MRRCSASLMIREEQIKTTARYHLTCLKMAFVKTRQETTRVSENVEKKEKSKCPSVDKWVKKCNVTHTHTHTHIYIHIFFSAMRKKEILPCSWITWMDFEDITLNEIYQIEIQISCDITYRWNQKNKSHLEKQNVSH